MYRKEHVSGLRFDYWKALKEIERQETHAMSIVRKWQEKYDIVRDAEKYGVDPEKMEIWVRVAKLKRLYESGALSGWPGFK